MGERLSRKQGHLGIVTDDELPILELRFRQAVRPIGAQDFRELRKLHSVAEGVAHRAAQETPNEPVRVLRLPGRRRKVGEVSEVCLLRPGLDGAGACGPDRGDGGDGCHAPLDEELRRNGAGPAEAAPAVDENALSAGEAASDEMAEDGPPSLERAIRRSAVDDRELDPLHAMVADARPKITNVHAP